jgi:MscS family membrane protein
MMRDMFPPPGVTSCLLGAFLWGYPLVVAGQDATPKGGTPGITSARATAASVDPRFRSPRATVRTFLIAMNRTEDDPHRIEEAIACLDLSGMPPDRRDGGRLAFELEFILRSTNMPTGVMTDVEDGTKYEIGENKDVKLTLRRMTDGRWLFDSKTLQDLRQMRLSLWQRALAAAHGKDAGDVQAEYRSPYASFHTFIDSFKTDNLDTAATCLDLTEIPDPARGIVGRELALKLKEVLDRSVFVIFQDIPDSSVGVPLEALVHKEGRIVAERQVAGVRKGQWLFNRATVRSLDRLYDAFESQPILPEVAAMGRTNGGPGFTLSPGLWLRRRMPGWFRYRVGPTDQLSFALYQLVGLVLLVLLVVPVYRLVASLLARPARALVRWRGVTAEEGEVTAWVRPIGWLAAVWVLVRGVTMLELPTEAAGAVLAVLVPAFWIAAALAVYQLIDPILKLVAGPAVMREGATTFAAMGFPVLSLVLKIVVVVSGLAAVLRLFNFDLGTVLAGLGIGGLAIALAAQDTLKNFFGSLMLIADRTFRVGDLVKIGENEGVVETVGLRSTRIRGLDDALLTVPNSDLTTAHVTNFGARRYRRFRTRITVAHGTPPDRLIQFRDGILGLVRGHARVRQQKYEVAVNDLGASGIEILIQVFFEVPDAHTELTARDGLILDILRLAERLGISFDSPTIVIEREQRAETGKIVGNSVPFSSPQVPRE